MCEERRACGGEERERERGKRGGRSEWRGPVNGHTRTLCESFFLFLSLSLCLSFSVTLSGAAVAHCARLSAPCPFLWERRGRTLAVLVSLLEGAVGWISHVPVSLFFLSPSFSPPVSPAPFCVCLCACVRARVCVFASVFFPYAERAPRTA